MKIGNPGSFMFNFCYISSICIAVTVHLTVWNMFSWAIAVSFFFPFVSLRSILYADVQAKDVLCVSQDSLCGGPLSLHGRVESPAGGVWRADKESRSRCYPSGTGFQVSLDLCCGVFHGVLQNPVRHFPKGQAGELTPFLFSLGNLLKSHLLWLASLCNAPKCTNSTKLWYLDLEMRAFKWCNVFIYYIFFYLLRQT